MRTSTFQISDFLGTGSGVRSAAKTTSIRVLTMGKEASLPWVEKYRPRAIADVAHQEEVVATLQKAVHESAGRGDLPHLLLYGPPGTGKTSTALALCRDLFGLENYKGRVLELNASDERGIAVVRDKIRKFAQSTVVVVKKGEKEYPCPPFKVIILDEADAITRDAQTALRRTMETFSKGTRFIIICNYISRIIGPLASRCAKFRFNPLPLPSMFAYLRKITTSENVDIDDKTLRFLVEAAEGDLRKAITTLQSAYRMQGPGAPLDIETISAAACLIPPAVVDSFDLATAAEGSTNLNIRRAVEDIVRSGFSASQLLSQYGIRLLTSQGGSFGVAAMNDLQKAAVALVLAEADTRLINGADEQLQLYNVGSRISRAAALEDDANSLRAV